eukprot:maker-scaffold_63-snap-gene-0.10-mRNA-1 protein AED:0.30 eAED:0.30 QI:65/1/1/1/1/1/2/65/387
MPSFENDIKAATESLQLDLKGFNFEQANDLVNKAFTVTRSLSEMIKITLTVGAGKEKRQKYDEDLPKWIMTALKALDYTESRSSDTSFSSVGTFKYQHDTNKNLKFLHIFPRAVQKIQGEPVPEPLQKDENSEESLLLSSPLSSFSSLLIRAPSWTLKKRIKNFLLESREIYTLSEKKLFSRKILTEKEEKIYEESTDLVEKIKYVTKCMKDQVSEGELTENERQSLLQAAKKTENEKRIEVLEGMKGKTLFKVKGCAFVEVERVEESIRKLLSCEMIEEKAGAKGIFSSKLSTKEIRLLKEKVEVEEELAQLEQEERWILESKEEVKQRFKEFKQKIEKVLQKKKEVRIEANGGWSTTGAAKKKKPDFSKAFRKPQTGRFQAFLDD